MSTRTTSWVLGFTVLGGALSAAALADASVQGLYNPLGLYIGGSVGRATINQTQYDGYAGGYRHIDGEPLGWNAVVGVRPVSFLGAEAEFIDFGDKRLSAQAPYAVGSYTNQFLGGDAHDTAAAVFAVGYLPLPVPWMEIFGKLGWAQIREHDSYSGIYNNTFVNGVPVGQTSASQTTHPNGAAYGAGVQFHFSQLAVRAQYERISGSRDSAGWNNPDLLSVGVNWTF